MKYSVLSVPGTFKSLHLLAYLNLITTLESGCYHHFHFTDEETEEQAGSVSYPGSQGES